LIFSNIEDLILNLNSVPPLGASDHLGLLFEINCALRFEYLNKERYLYNRAQFVNMANNSPKDEDWDRLFDNTNCEESLNIFMMIIKDLVDSFVPIQKVRTIRKIRNKWITKKIKRLLRSKRKLWNVFRNSGLEKDYIKYKHVRNNVKWEIKKAKIAYERRLVDGVKINSRLFWNYVNAKIKVKPSIPSFYIDDRVIDDDTRKAEIFNNYFMSVFKNENVDSVPNLPQKMLITEPLNNIEITRGMVEDKLLKLKVDKSPGPDGLHPRILKELGQVISYPLKIIFSKSLEEAHVPTAWKLANVKPIYKKGLKSDKANYRPVSLLSVLNKVLETLISERIVDYLMKNGLISKYQHGFVKGRSCLTELLEALEIWVDGLDNRISVDVVYFDIMKAFDTVPHRRLLTILGSFGISGNLVKWIEDYLSGRLQRVVINGCSSSWSLITSGVPQGSVLGPLLFLIFINGLTEVIDSHIRLFADDTKIFRLIRSGNDCDLLQNDILRLNQWAERWQIDFHPEKTKVLRIGKYHPAPEKEYFMLNDAGNREIFNFVTEEKDLGVIVMST